MSKNFNINDHYFFLSVRYLQKPSDFGLKKIDNKYFVDNNLRKYYHTHSYDFGWGQENGYVLDREYTFTDLIKLALYESENENLFDKNHYGAIDFIINGTSMQKNFIIDFIKYIENNLLISNCLSDYNKKFLKKFFYGEWSNGINERYMRKLDNDKDWLRIKNQTLELLGNK